MHRLGIFFNYTISNVAILKTSKWLLCVASSIQPVSALQMAGIEIICEGL